MTIKFICPYCDHIWTPRKATVFCNRVRKDGRKERNGIRVCPKCNRYVAEYKEPELVTIQLIKR